MHCEALQLTDGLCQLLTCVHEGLRGDTAFERWCQHSRQVGSAVKLQSFSKMSALFSKCSTCMCRVTCFCMPYLCCSGRCCLNKRLQDGPRLEAADLDSCSIWQSQLCACAPVNTNLQVVLPGVQQIPAYYNFKAGHSRDRQHDITKISNAMRRCLLCTPDSLAVDLDHRRRHAEAISCGTELLGRQQFSCQALECTFSFAFLNAVCAAAGDSRMARPADAVRSPGTAGARCD